MKKPGREKLPGSAKYKQKKAMPSTGGKREQQKKKKKKNALGDRDRHNEEWARERV